MPVTGPAEVGDDLREPQREGGQLGLLALEDSEATTLAHLQQEHAVAHFAQDTHHHLVGVVEDVVHEGARSFSEPVLFTHSTTGTESVKTNALTEHGEITVRWKRSRGTPWA